MKKIFNKYTTLLAGALLFAFPIISFAQATGKKDLKYLAGLAIDYLNIAIYLVIALAVVTFTWNVYRYFFTEKEKKEAGLYVMYSVIGFFVILSFWGLVAILRNSLNLNDNTPSFPSFFNNSGSGGNNNSIFDFNGYNAGVRYDQNIFNNNGNSYNTPNPGGGVNNPGDTELPSDGCFDGDCDDSPGNEEIPSDGCFDGLCD